MISGLHMGQLHDASSRILFFLAGLALTAASGLYLFEVISRYIFNAPTTWSGEVIQYCLTLLIFFALPDISRRSAHISIDIVHDYLSKKTSYLLNRAGEFVASLACATASWIIAREAIKQYERGLLTNAAHPIPRWWITSVIALGLISAAIHFLRHGLARR